MPDAALEVLRAFGLERAGLAELAGGISGAVWKVQDAAGRWYVLRRHDHPRHPPAHVLPELVWLDALGQDKALRTPVPLRQANGDLAPVVEAGPDGRTRALWTVSRWLDGETLGRLPDGHEAALIGSMLAALHRRAKSWAPPPGLARPVYDAAHFKEAARELLNRAGAQLEARARLSLNAALLRSTDVLERLEQDREQVGLIHADLHDGNIIYGGEPRQAGAIDFARFGFGCWALDLAMAMHYLTEELGRPLFEAYSARFGLTLEAQRALPNLRFLAAIDNLAILSTNPDEAEYLASELASLTAQAERLVG